MGIGPGGRRQGRGVPCHATTRVCGRSGHDEPVHNPSGPLARPISAVGGTPGRLSWPAPAGFHNPPGPPQSCPRHSSTSSSGGYMSPRASANTEAPAVVGRSESRSAGRSGDRPLRRVGDEMARSRLTNPPGARTPQQPMGIAPRGRSREPADGDDVAPSVDKPWRNLTGYPEHRGPASATRWERRVRDD